MITIKFMLIKVRYINLGCTNFGPAQNFGPLYIVLVKHAIHMTHIDAHTELFLTDIWCTKTHPLRHILIDIDAPMTHIPRGSGGASYN